MLDYILLGLISGLFVFCLLFLISFVSLSLITGIVRFSSLVLDEFGLSRHTAVQEQTA